MIRDEIITKLNNKQDVSYREMQIKIIPNIPVESIIGVRTLELRKMANSFARR